MNLLRELRTLAYQDAEQIRGFMSLLMKPRNGSPWTADDKARLKGHLKIIGRTLPLIGLLSLPGGMLILPLLALMLDRRSRKRRQAAPTEGENAACTREEIVG